MVILEHTSQPEASLKEKLQCGLYVAFISTVTGADQLNKRSH